MTSANVRFKIEEQNNGSVSDLSDGILSFLPISLTLTSPNGGERWAIGSTQTIKWTTIGIVDVVTIEYTTDNGTTWNNINYGTPNTGSLAWTVANIPSTNVKLRIHPNYTTSIIDMSDAPFTIGNNGSAPPPVTATLTVTSPNGGESWTVGTTQNITWVSTGTISSVKIEYSSNNGVNWSLVTASAVNSGTFAWTVPNAVSSNCFVRISDGAGSGVSDISNAVFTIIAAPTIFVSSPNGGENWTTGTTQNITWTTTGPVGNVKIEYTTDNGTTWAVVNATTGNTGAYSWVVPNTASVNCKVRMSQASTGTPVDISNARFPSLEHSFQPPSKVRLR